MVADAVFVVAEFVFVVVDNCNLAEVDDVLGLREIFSMLSFFFQKGLRGVTEISNQKKLK